MFSDRLAYMGCFGHGGMQGEGGMARGLMKIEDEM